SVPAPQPLQHPAKGGTPAKTPPSTASQTAQPVGPGSTHALGRLSVQMNELESDLRAVTGSMEEFNFQIGNISRRLDKLVADVDYRLGLLEGRAPGSTPGSSTGAQAAPSGPPRLTPAPAPPSVQKIIPGQPTPFASKPGVLGTVSKSAVDALSQKNGEKKAGKPSLASPARPVTSPGTKPVVAAPRPAAPAPGILPKGSVKEQYTFAFGLLRQANYDKAEVALQEFVKRHPKDKLAANARYWLGETYYVRAAYVQAAEVFLEGYQADPKGQKAPDSLLKLGMSLSGLDKKREACAAFDKVSKDYPDASPGIRNTVAREKQKNSCP
ncbi:MAG: tol-pal system protein YbgF, partial [Alphaproteobacteria bacterium]|nr:tol-pal system protein YbgF [Alphaproteobacteria bacterium]